ncbi:type II inositol 1,4,5-trisphosphate 5-phosphatase [Contarinia nasturtii]|uniref:type II inositol 1,4,5-trisphosphate 5-phosphatase n=1 Tax=Contarinia nasturtii TaxID=265458 RepID=UPI0012D4128A|nr:type II inositol 1,4,5-trisphosphate 5-phosphatase [Contarinia nasturtii]
MNFDNLITENLVLNIVKDKLRHDENVISICETYQIIGGEYKNRLLALVAHGDTSAIFAFASSKWPPELFSDLTIECVYPLNEQFMLDTSSSSNITEYQFKIHSSQGQSVYYYYPFKSAHAKSFSSFHEDCKAISASIPKMNDPEHFKWTQKYRREDQSAIDRNIADGTITLQRRESKFREELERREFEYIVHKDFTIYTATWNVNGRPCGDIELKPWLSATENPPDIYAVAFQELDLSPKAITFSENRPDPIWIRRIMSSLNPNAIYEELVSVRLVGMMLTVIVRQELRKNVLRYSTQAVGTGALNFMGNKGGVGVSMQINEASICFVNSHLAAHSSEIERRKEDHDEIIRRMQFEYGISRRSIDEHNHIFWIGDLNYRLVDNPPRSVFDVNFSEIIKHDQLYQEMQRRRVFLNYTEGAINFRPTYKYDPGTDEWDSSEKNRPPAWCDRVLWKGERISQLEYNSVMSLRLSDHKPVYAIFSTGIKTKDEQKYKRVHEDVLRGMDKYENDNQPQITVEKTDIDFDIMQFNESYTRDITVANNCHLPVRFEFRGKEENGKKICEPWLHVEPTHGELITGDSLSIRFKIFIDVHHAWRMHRKQKTSNTKVPLDILVLHVENGRDIFITVLGEYRPSCFGFSVETLARLPQPVYELDLKDLLKIESDLNSSYSSSVYKVLNIPREIYQLVDYLNRNGLRTPNLFTVERKYATNPLINDIRDWLNLWSPTDFPGNPYTAAEALLMLLESPPEPLASPMEEECLYAESFDKCCEIIKVLSGPKKNTFLYICMFLNELLKFTPQNRLESIKLATIFGRVMLDGHGNSSKSIFRSLTEKDRDERRTAFMHKFLCNDIKDFARDVLTAPI